MITFQPSMCHTTFYMLLKQNKKKKGSIEGTRDFAIIVVWWSSESSAGGGKNVLRNRWLRTALAWLWERRGTLRANLSIRKEHRIKEKIRKRCTRAELRLAIFFSLRLIKKKPSALYTMKLRRRRDTCLRLVASNFQKISRGKKRRCESEPSYAVLSCITGRPWSIVNRAYLIVPANFIFWLRRQSS